MATGNGSLPHITNETSLGNVLLALVTVEEEDEVVMKALLGLPFQFPSVAQQMVEQGVGVKGEEKLFSVETSRLIVDVRAV